MRFYKNLPGVIMVLFNVVVSCLIRTTLRLVGLLPVRLLLPITRIVGTLVWMLTRRRRHIVRRNLDIAFGDTMSPQEKSRLSRKSFQHAASSAASFTFQNRWLNRAYRDRFTVSSEDNAVLEAGSKTGTAVLFISHNMAVVSQLCDRMYVMYAGKIVETGRTSAVLHTPRHPYTGALLRSLPERGTRKRALATIPGTVPTLLKPPEGCVFEERCPEAHARCGRPPPFFQADGDDGHFSACWLYAPEDTTEEAEA